MIDRLFDFFVRITKVSHLAHVVVMTSDTFLIEEVYTNSALKNSSRFYPVDYFDDDTAVKILKEKFRAEEAKEMVSWMGGVPWMMMESSLTTLKSSKS